MKGQGKNSTSTRALTDLQLFEQEYWTSLRSYMAVNSSIVKLRNPRPRNWDRISIGRTDYHLAIAVNSRDKSINIWLTFIGSRAKQDFDELYRTASAESYRVVHKELVWDRMSRNKRSAVMLKEYADFTDKTDWGNQFLWFKENLERFYMFFKPKVMYL